MFGWGAEKLAGNTYEQIMTLCQRTNSSIEELERPIGERKFDPDLLAQWKRISLAAKEKLTFCDNAFITNPLFAKTLMALHINPDFRTFINIEQPAAKFAILAQKGSDRMEGRGRDLKLIRGTDYSPFAGYDYEEFQTLLRQVNDSLQSKEPISSGLLTQMKGLTAATADALESFNNSDILPNETFLATLRNLYRVPEFREFIKLNAAQLHFLILSKIGLEEIQRNEGTRTPNQSDEETSGSFTDSSYISGDDTSFVSPFKPTTPTPYPLSSSSSSLPFDDDQPLLIAEPSGGRKSGGIIRRPNRNIADLGFQLEEVTKNVTALIEKTEQAQAATGQQQEDYKQQVAALSQQLLQQLEAAVTRVTSTVTTSIGNLQTGLETADSATAKALAELQKGLTIAIANLPRPADHSDALQKIQETLEKSLTDTLQAIESLGQGVGEKDAVAARSLQAVEELKRTIQTASQSPDYTEILGQIGQSLQTLQLSIRAAEQPGQPSASLAAQLADLHSLITARLPASPITSSSNGQPAEDPHAALLGQISRRIEALQERLEQQKGPVLSVSSSSGNIQGQEEHMLDMSALDERHPLIHHPVQTPPDPSKTIILSSIANCAFALLVGLGVSAFVWSRTKS